MHLRKEKEELTNKPAKDENKMEPRSKHQEQSAHCDALSGAGDRLLMQVRFSCSHWEIVPLFGNPVPSTLEMETEQFFLSICQLQSYFSLEPP